MITAGDIAKLIDSTVVGDDKIQVRGMAPSAFAKEGDITFAFSEEELKEAGKSKASCVLTTASVQNYPKTILYTKDMKLAMTVIYNAMLQIKPPQEGNIHPSAIIAKDVELGPNVSIGPNVVIEENIKLGDNTTISANCVIGKNVTIGQASYLYPNVTIYDYTVIGNNVTIHSGTVIGSDGFGYVPKDGKIYKVPQMGNVIIEDNVEIGANVCIDRGTFTNTVIARGTKIDNQVQIAHNVKLGKNVLIAAQTGIAGSTTVDENTMMGGNVGIADHVHIGKNVKIGAKTGVTGNVKDNEIIFGYPHRRAAEARKLHALLSLILKNASKFKKFLWNLPDK